MPFLFNHNHPIHESNSIHLHLFLAGCRLLNSLSEADMRALLTQVVERQPGVLFNIHQYQSRSHQGSSPEHHGRNNNVPGWCVCENCWDMPIDLEKKCCGRQSKHDCLSESAVRKYKMVLFIVYPQ